MNTTVPWFPIALVVAALVAAVLGEVIEALVRRARRRDGLGWKGPGW